MKLFEEAQTDLHDYSDQLQENSSENDAQS
jgi:hypothetical protein